MSGIAMTPVINYLKESKLLMEMIAYRVTEEKLHEYFKESFSGYFNPLKSKRLLFMFGMFLGGFILTFIITYFWLKMYRGIILIIITVIFISFGLLSYFLMRNTFRHEIAKEMKSLVNDPELLWLNNQKPEDSTSRLKRTNEGSLPQTTFKTLAYLKKEGTSQGLHTKIKSMKNSNSAYQTLKRLAKKKTFGEPIINNEGNDFTYIPWQFKLVNRKNHQINTKKATKIEKLLSNCWELMMEEEIS